MADEHVSLFQVAKKEELTFQLTALSFPGMDYARWDNQ